MRNTVAVITAAMFLSSAAWAEDKFDLKCQTTSTRNGSSSEKVERHYRVDLVEKKWCEGECFLQKPVVRFDEKEIFLEKHPESDQEQLHINRLIGYVNRFIVGGDPSRRFTEFGPCVAAKFTPFPQPKF